LLDASNKSLSTERSKSIRVQLAPTLIAPLLPIAARVVNGGSHTLYRDHCERRLRRWPSRLGRMVPVPQPKFVRDRRLVPCEAIEIARDEFDPAQT
jgi:hypothetical protein